MNIGQRVRLKFFPSCDGEIVEIMEPLKVGDMIISKRYRVMWDNPDYGVSDWLSDNDLWKI